MDADAGRRPFGRKPVVGAVLSCQFSGRVRVEVRGVTVAEYRRVDDEYEFVVPRGDGLRHRPDDFAVGPQVERTDEADRPVGLDEIGDCSGSHSGAIGSVADSSGVDHVTSVEAVLIRGDDIRQPRRSERSVVGPDEAGQRVRVPR